MINPVVSQLDAARKAFNLGQERLAQKAGLSRMTVQRILADQIDPRLSTVLELARALGLDLMLVPSNLRGELEDFVRSGGRYLAQPAGTGAPPSVVDTLTATTSSENRKR